MIVFLGIVLLLSPFILLGTYKFETILTFTIVSNLIIAVMTQSLHVFNHIVVVILYLVVILFVLLKIKKIKKIPKPDWTLIVIIVVALISLVSIHYSYSGKYSTINTFQQGQKMVYPYPYYADEWYAVAFIKDSIKTQSLPLVDPLFVDRPHFRNFEIAFHSLLSEIVVLLDINPIKRYSILAIFSSMLTCVLMYLFLKRAKVNSQSAGIAALSLLYITNGATLPGLWYLIPFNLGLILLLLSLIFLDSGNKKMIFLTSFLVALFYPPLFVFQAVAVIAFFLTKENKLRNLIYYVSIVSFVGVVLYFLAGAEGIKELFYSKIFYQNFTAGIHKLTIWNIIPLPILLPSIFGVFLFYKKRMWLTSTLLLGLVYWFVYPLTLTRFMIEYQRVVIVTAVFFVIYMGLFLGYCVDKFKWFKSAQIVVLFFILIFSFNYTNNNSWEKLTMYDKESDITFMPSAPANRYLQKKDLEVFKNIRGKNFLSQPWKGTTIGISTDNYPIETKAGTISHNCGLFREFTLSDCKGKENIVQAYDIDYVYSYSIDCDGFDFVSRGADNLFLYKTTKH